IMNSPPPSLTKLIIALLFAALLPSFTAAQEITVAAAADLNYALKDLAARFEQNPQKLAAAGLMDSASLRSYAFGHLVLWVPNAGGLNPQELKMDLLLQPSVKHIAIANPRHAPYGRAAMVALEHYGLKDKLASKLVFGENVSQAAQFVQSGNAQA